MAKDRLGYGAFPSWSKRKYNTYFGNKWVFSFLLNKVRDLVFLNSSGSLFEIVDAQWCVSTLNRVTVENQHHRLCFSGLYGHKSSAWLAPHDGFQHLEEIKPSSVPSSSSMPPWHSVWNVWQLSEVKQQESRFRPGRTACRNSAWRRRGILLGTICKNSRFRPWELSCL